MLIKNKGNYAAFLAPQPLRGIKNVELIFDNSSAKKK